MFKELANINQDAWNNYFTFMFDNNAASMLTFLLHPKSRGTVLLKDKRFSSKPIINPNYLSHSDDGKLLVDGLKFSRKFAESPIMSEFGVNFNTMLYPGCQKFVFGTVDYWTCYVRHQTLIIYHQVGTCKMRHINDTTSVVDYDFRVIGTNKLCVADGSVMPFLIGGHTNVAIALLAEKAADAIKYYKYLEAGTCDIEKIFIQIKYCKNYEQNY